MNATYLPCELAVVVCTMQRRKHADSNNENERVKGAKFTPRDAA